MVVQEKIEVKICIRIKVKDRISIPVDRGGMVLKVKDKDRGMDKINMVIRVRIKVNTAIKDIRTKDTRINTRIKVIEGKDKPITVIPDHTIRINIILGSMLVRVISHLHNLLRGIILRTSPGPLLPIFVPFQPS